MRISLKQAQLPDTVGSMFVSTKCSDKSNAARQMLAYSNVPNTLRQNTSNEDCNSIA